MKSLLARLRPYALIAGFGGVVLVLALAVVLDFGFGEDLLLVAPHEPGTVEVNRALYMDEDTIAHSDGFAALARDLTRLVEVLTAIRPDMLTQASRGPL